MGGSGEAQVSPPAAELIDFTHERGRHRRFVGRDDVLARLDEWLLGPDDTGWVLVTGGPGVLGPHAQGVGPGERARGSTLEGHADGVTACALTPDRRRVVSVSWDHTLKVWNLARGRAEATLEGHGSGVTGAR